MSLVEARERRERLRNPPNAVRDYGIDLKRKVIPIEQRDEPQEVPVKEEPSIEVFGPRVLTLDDLAFGPLVHPDIKPQPMRVAMIATIQCLVADHYGISVRELLSNRRTPRVVRPRQVAMYLAKTLTLRSLPEIGRRFAGRDHTTVLHSVRKIAAERLTDPVLDSALNGLENLLVAFPYNVPKDATCSSPPQTSTAP
jgi:hypothetical protein